MLHESCLLAAAFQSWGTFLSALLPAVILGGVLVWGGLRLRTRATLAARQAEIDLKLAEARQRREELLKGAEVEAQKKLLEMMDRF